MRIDAAALLRRGALLGVVLMTCALAFAHVARADVAVPALQARVTDLTGTLTAQQTQQLDAQLAALEQRKGAQVVVLVLPSTQPEDIVDYATRVFDAWKVGRKGVDDGVLVVVAKDDQRAMIETGYGLEGAIPDAAASRIIREYMAPKFRVGDYYGGLGDALGALAKLIDGESLPAPLQAETRGQRHGGDWIAALFAAWVAMMVARGVFRPVPRWPRAGLVGAVTGGLGWIFSGLWPLALALGVIGAVAGFVNRGGGLFAGHGGSGGWGGGGFGGGFGGGSGGGGFGGGSFGGGGFSGGGGMTGGGGASGSW